MILKLYYLYLEKPWLARSQLFQGFPHKGSSPRNRQGMEDEALNTSSRCTGLQKAGVTQEQEREKLQHVLTDKTL